MRQKMGIILAEDRDYLLSLARRTVEQAVSAPVLTAVSKRRVVGRFGGVFVTLRVGGLLRGCIGSFAPTSDIGGAVVEVTKSSLADVRFQAKRITVEDLDRLCIEISILSDLESTRNPLSLMPGIHGVVIRRGGRSGCFLPKVAAERGWTAEEFLSKCCTMKAELPPDAWKKPGTQVLLFTADVFAEVSSEPGAGG